MTESIVTRDQLRAYLEELFVICESPRLYLANFFSSLKSEVDIEMTRKQLACQQDNVRR